MPSIQNPGLMVSQVYSTKHLKKNLHLSDYYPYSDFSKKMKITLLNSFHEASITLTPKLDQDTSYTQTPTLCTCKTKCKDIGILKICSERKRFLLVDEKKLVGKRKERKEIKY